MRLADLVRSETTLLILDGLEPLQYPPGPRTGRIRDDALAVLVRELTALNSGLCVITTREPVSDIAAQLGKTAARIDLAHLLPATGARLLRDFGALGTEAELQAASNAFNGHALALTLLGTYVRDICGGDIKRSQQFKLVPSNPEAGKEARRMLSSYEAWFRNNGQASRVAVLLLLGFSIDRRIPRRYGVSGPQQT